MPGTTQQQHNATPAWKREDYEFDMADRIIAAAATLRHASLECGKIESKAILLSAVAKDAKWRYWDAKRASAANDIVLCVQGMRGMGYDTDPFSLGDFVKAKYREMLLNEREFLKLIDEGRLTWQDYEQGLAGGLPQFKRRCPRIFVQDDWLKGLDACEVIALAPETLKNYNRQFKCAY